MPPPQAVNLADQRDPGTKNLAPGPVSATLRVGGKETDRGISLDREGMATLAMVANMGVREAPVASQGTHAGRLEGRGKEKEAVGEAPGVVVVLKRHVGEVPTVTLTGEVRIVVQLKNRVAPAVRGAVG